jgi:uncharacterized protein YggE
MSSTIRSFLFSTSAALAASIFLVTRPVMAQQAPGTSGSPGAQSVSVIGEGIATGLPARARVTVGVEVTGGALTAAQDEASRRIAEVIQRLRSSGIGESEIQTVSYTVSPEYDSSSGPGMTLRGYLLQHLLEIETRDVARVGDLVDQATAAGANRVAGVVFEAEEASALELRAREQALQNARTAAEQLARRMSLSLGVVQLVEEISAVGTPSPATVRTPIQPGNVQVRSTVRVVWSAR